MKRESAGPILSTVFVDYDNIYLSLKRKSEEAAKRFAKDSGVWLQGILSGELITPTSAFAASTERRVVMNRCYGNPVPRRNAHDNSTDMNSFPFVRHHFLRAGFEVIDCPPLTAQLKNSADIRIVMDIRDILNHDTFFDEFIILSGDADFTPLLHRLRAHARRTVVFANDHTAQPYTAISDGEVRESNLINLLLSGRTLQAESPREIESPRGQPSAADLEAARNAVLSEVIGFVRSAPQAVPMETLADRCVRMVGRDKTVGTNWGGYGTFRELLLAGLPDDIHLSDTPPYTVFDAARHITATGLLAPQLPAPATVEIRAAAPAAAAVPHEPEPAPRQHAPQQQAQQRAVPQQQAVPQRGYQPAPQQQRYAQPFTPAAAHAPQSAEGDYVHTRVPQHAAYQQPLAEQQIAPQAPAPRAPRNAPMAQPAHQPAAAAPPHPRNAEQATQIQQSIARIHEACQAPALAPAEYRVLFDVMAQEITANGLQGGQTLANITQRAREFGLDIRREDLRFILDVVSETDPWFEQGASANLFSSRFRNFVVARCRSQGLSLSADELDLIEAWFGSPAAQQSRAPARQAAPQQQAPAAHAPQGQAATAMTAPAGPSGERWWSLEEGRQHIAEQRSQGSYGAEPQEEEFPRIVRSRMRG